MAEELLLQFQGAFAVSEEPNDTSAPHPRFSQYKQKRAGYADQAVRRARILEEQKCRRRDFAFLVRKIAEGDFSEEDGKKERERNGEGEGEEGMEINSSRSKRKERRFRNQLMLSEWMVDPPLELEEEWLLVVCPIGKRCLVVASKGVTTAYSRVGHFLRHFPSGIPGGSRKNCRRSECTILDCIYQETDRTYYVLDMMCWRGNPVYDSDTEFRCYWMNTKLREEASTVSEISKTNPFRFQPLDYHSCSRESLVQLLGSKWPVEVDGLLFIHKRAHYTLGRSPLAVWLKAQMVTGVLGLPVSGEFLSCAPVLSDVKVDTKMDTGAIDQSEGLKDTCAGVEMKTCTETH